MSSIPMTSIALCVATGYFATSMIFFCFPNILRKRKTFKNPILQKAIDSNNFTIRVCHRGASRYTTENTIEGFRKVCTISDMLEMDVCETKDKILVVHHDKSLLRTCGVNKQINELNYNELPKFKDEIELDFSEGKTITSNNERIPKLEEVFQIFQGTLMNIELKTPTDSAITEFNRLIQKYEREDETIVGIRNSKQADLKKLNPKLNLFTNDAAVLKLFLLYFIGLLPFVPIAERSIQLPLYTTEFHNWKLLGNPDEKMKISAMFSAIKFANFMMRPLFWHLKKRGVLSMLWVCNEEEHYERALKKGAQGIMTDDPYLLDEFIKKKNQKLDSKENQEKPDIASKANKKID